MEPSRWISREHMTQFKLFVVKQYVFVVEVYTFHHHSSRHRNLLATEQVQNKLKYSNGIAYLLNCIRLLCSSLTRIIIGYSHGV